MAAAPITAAEVTTALQEMSGWRFLNMGKSSSGDTSTDTWFLILPPGATGAAPILFNLALLVNPSGSASGTMHEAKYLGFNCIRYFPGVDGLAAVVQQQEFDPVGNKQFALGSTSLLVEKAIVGEWADFKFTLNALSCRGL